MTIDPVELERLSKAVEQSGPMTASALVDLLGGERRETQRLIQAAIDRGVLTVGAGLKVELRTGQLVPAQPSGDEVEAVAMAICEASGDVWRTGEGMRSPFAAQADRVNNHWRFKATAAIAAYEAASGVAKMREALRAFHDGALSRSETIARIDAALGEKP